MTKIRCHPILKAGQSISMADFPHHGSFVIGANSSTAQHALDGYLDDLFVADMALDDTQAAQYHQDQLHTLSYPGVAACLVETAQGIVTAEGP